ncbi:hypothetical protein BUALT_Bualt02G0213000 [Buddleja alternifolia]|uniref:Exocyst subunit Exo70 family protein n=1 Tax=Buddleja alternifolia TaxID=168488 RepID=A0AAV6Y6B0_9LAMI|nr:hypothetical protein BUALT_Bualt02G0213000 [Buddleja alternifolia]
MSRIIYDNWQRLVEATLKREQYYQLCRAHSRTTSIASSLSSSDFTFPSPASIAASAADAGDDVVGRVENALQLAMTRLEDEFRLILIRNTVVPLDPDHLHRSSSSLSSSTAAIAIAATEFLNDETNESFEDVSSGRYSSLELIIPPEDVNDLREIADMVIRSGYEKECSQVYCSVRGDVLDQCMLILGVEKLTIEEAQRIEWWSVDDNIKKWIQAVKVVVRGVLSSEKHLCEEIFAGSDFIKEACFPETWRGCVMQLLDFGEAVATGRRSGEKLFRILDMYDALAEVLPDLQAIFMDQDAGDMVCGEARGVLDGLGKAAIGTLVEFEYAVKGEASKKPIQNGEIHPLARYVMNYAKLLVDYSNTLNSLLEVESGQPDMENNDNTQGESMSCISRRLLALITSLESNIEEKSRLYEDNAMQYIFLMNNIFYIVQKVEDCEMVNLLGDNWIRKRRGMVGQYAILYLRASWSRAFSWLKYEGIVGHGSSFHVSKVALRDRFKNFNACFEGIYRIQTVWKVPDPQLREELRIFISEKLIPAYRSFMGRFGSLLEIRYIKYTPEDLENYLMDLFEGTPLVLHHLRKKWFIKMQDTGDSIIVVKVVMPEESLPQGIVLSKCLSRRYDFLELSPLSPFHRRLRRSRFFRSESPLPLPSPPPSKSVLPIRVSTNHLFQADAQPIQSQHSTIGASDTSKNDLLIKNHNPIKSGLPPKRFNTFSSSSPWKSQDCESFSDSEEKLAEPKQSSLPDDENGMCIDLRTMRVPDSLMKMRVTEEEEEEDVDVEKQMRVTYSGYIQFFPRRIDLCFAREATTISGYNQSLQGAKKADFPYYQRNSPQEHEITSLEGLLHVDVEKQMRVTYSGYIQFFPRRIDLCFAREATTISGYNQSLQGAKKADFPYYQRNSPQEHEITSLEGLLQLG